MIHEIYSIHDKAVNAFLQPFFSVSLASATRSLQHVLSDPEHAFSKNVHDFTLYRLGEFNDSTGELTRPDVPILITPLERLKTTV